MNVLNTVVCTTRDFGKLSEADDQFLTSNHLVNSGTCNDANMIVINDFDEFFRDELSVFVKVCSEELSRNFLNFIFFEIKTLSDNEYMVVSHMANGHVYRSSKHTFSATNHNFGAEGVLAVPYEIAKLIVKNKLPKHVYHNWVIVKGHNEKDPFVASYELSINGDVWAYSFDNRYFGTDKNLLSIEGLTALYNPIKIGCKGNYAGIKLEKIIGICNLVKGFQKAYKRTPALGIAYGAEEFSFMFQYKNEKERSDNSTWQVLRLPNEKATGATAEGVERWINAEFLLDLLGNNKKNDCHLLYIDIESGMNNVFFKHRNTEMIIARYLAD